MNWGTWWQLSQPRGIGSKPLDKGGNVMMPAVLFEKFDCCDYVPHVDKKMIC